MGDWVMLQNYLIVGALLFSIGLIGFLVRRNMIVMFLAAEMMLQGISISLVAWSRFHNDWGGQIMVIFIIAVAACEAAIALVLMLMLFNRSGSLDIALWQQLREEGQPPYTDRQIPEQLHEHAVWPTLTPAGTEPEHDQEKESHRAGV